MNHDFCSVDDEKAKIPFVSEVPIIEAVDFRIDLPDQDLAKEVHRP